MGLTCMDFSCTVKALKLGRRVKRASKPFIYYIDGDTGDIHCTWKFEDQAQDYLSDSPTLESSDILANDWCVID